MEKNLERKLLLQIQGGDAEAFGQIYTAYVPRIFRYLLFKVARREEAEDLCAEVFLRTWQYLSQQPRQVKSLRALLYRIAKHLVIDYYRQRTQTAGIADESAADEVIDERQQRLFERAEQSLTITEIEQALRTLKDEYREIVVLRFVEELSISEIAHVTSRSNGHVRVMLYRALRLLRHTLDTTRGTPHA